MISFPVRSSSETETWRRPYSELRLYRETHPQARMRRKRNQDPREKKVSYRKINPSPALDLFLRHFGLDLRAPRAELLRDVIRHFARMPYENLTKILRHDSEGDDARALRTPHIVVGDHARQGTGGTCFSLTWTLLDLLRSLGWRADPILADRRYGENTHCALLVWVDDVPHLADPGPHLVDPGFLIVDPVPIDVRRTVRIETAFNEVLLEPTEGGSKLDLSTVQSGQTVYRLTLKLRPVDDDEFRRVWESSFDWDMMRYPLLSRVDRDRQLYVHGSRFQTRAIDRVDRIDLPRSAWVDRIASDFGIDPRLIGDALRVLERKGERLGSS